MKNQNDQIQKLTRDQIYLIILAVTVIPLYIITDTKENSQNLYYFSLILLGLNTFLFLKSRFFLKIENPYKSRLIILFSLYASIWLFFHCLFKSFPGLSFKTFIIINRLSNLLSDFNSFKSGAISFLLANIALFTIGLIEFLIARKKIDSLYRFIYIIAISLSFYIILNYLVFIPKIIISKPEAKLVNLKDTVIIKPDQYWDLFYQGKKIDLNYKDITYKWYFNNKYLTNEKNCRISKFGNYEVILVTNYGDIKSEKLSIK